MEVGFGKIGQPLRVALLGKLGGPSLDVVMAVIGKEETLLRVENLLKRDA
jgi:glutamyl-tRNA synthetase